MPQDESSTNGRLWDAGSVLGTLYANWKAPRWMKDIDQRVSPAIQGNWADLKAKAESLAKSMGLDVNIQKIPKGDLQHYGKAIKPDPGPFYLKPGLRGPRGFIRAVDDSPAPLAHEIGHAANQKTWSTNGGWGRFAGWLENQSRRLMYPNTLTRPQLNPYNMKQRLYAGKALSWLTPFLAGGAAALDPGGVTAPAISMLPLAGALPTLGAEALASFRGVWPGYKALGIRPRGVAGVATSFGTYLVRPAMSLLAGLTLSRAVQNEMERQKSGSEELAPHVQAMLDALKRSYRG